MEFTEYQARLSAFQRVFIMLFMVPDMKKKLDSSQYESSRKIIISFLRDWMTNPSDSDYIKNEPFPLIDLVKSAELSSISSVNLAADLETLTEQAEAVKKEIISLGKIFSSMPSMFRTKVVPKLYQITDYIRTPGGEIVKPFDYWEDCVEVYLRKYLFGKSNEKTAEGYIFKTSGSDTPRAKQSLVSKMLAEIELLKEAVANNEFPPQKLSGSKQPSMKLRG